MTKIYKFNIRGKILYMMEKESKSTYHLMDQYVPISGDVIIEDFTQKDEFFMYEIENHITHNAIQNVLLAANDVLPDGVDGIDIEYRSFSRNWGPSINSMIVTIKWGDVEITNSNEQRHPLLGMYTRIRINHYLSNGSMKMRDFQIFRDRLSALEHAHGYRHSHVRPGSSIRCFNDVCLGDSELRTLFMIRRISSKNFDFYRLFMYVESFIKWESLEGGPHITMTSVYSAISENIAQVPSSDDIINIVNSMDPEIILLPYKLTIPNNIIAEAVLNVPSIKKTIPNRGFTKKAAWWNDYTTSEVFSTEVPFRNEKMKVTIVPNTEEDDALTDTIFCSPDIRVVNMLSERFSDILTDNTWVEIEDDDHVDLTEAKEFIRKNEIDTIIDDMDENHVVEELNFLF